MNSVRRLAGLVLLLWMAGICTAAEEAVFRTRRLSERVLLLTENSPMENLVVAVASHRGLVVIDNCPSTVTAAAARKIIVETFGRQDFAYVVLTHGHWDHASGTGAFAGVPLVIHENAAAAWRLLAAENPQARQRYTQRIDDLTKQLAGLPTDAPNREAIALQLSFTKRNLAGLPADPAPGQPAITFRDKITLNLEDLHLVLTFFGRAHSGADVLIQIPEEKLLLTGDLFLDRGWLPLFAGLPRLDIPRWIEVLHDVLDGPDRPNLVIPGHREPWPVDKLALWREYIVNLWREVQGAKRTGEPLTALQARLPLPSSCTYLAGLGHSAEQLKRFQENTIRAFWNQLCTPADELVEAALATEGIEAARKKFRELRAANDPNVLFEERAFNTLGYKLLGQGNGPASLAVFELNAEAFPGSWNVYDSLGEALEHAGQTAAAILNFRRSLEINPNNANAKQALQRLASPPK